MPSKKSNRKKLSKPAKNVNYEEPIPENSPQERREGKYKCDKFAQNEAEEKYQCKKLPGAAKNVNFQKPIVENSQDESKGIYQCSHYMRKCKFYTPCCESIYRCRYCHDAEKDHVLTKENVTQLVCEDCNTIQPLQQNCQNCGLQFGKYFCLECKLFDDEEKRQQFHCKGCGICRIGEQDKYFHCDGCDMCLPINLKDKHTCIENVSHANCPVCLEDIHASREPSQIPPCHHLIHKSCFEQLTFVHNKLVCPVCNKSLYNEEALKPLWEFYDSEIKSIPMPEKYQDLFVEAICRNCQSVGMSTFHPVGLKCQHCGGYNTARNKGPFYKRVNDDYEQVDLRESRT